MFGLQVGNGSTPLSFPRVITARSSGSPLHGYSAQVALLPEIVRTTTFPYRLLMGQMLGRRAGMQIDRD